MQERKISPFFLYLYFKSRAPSADYYLFCIIFLALKLITLGEFILRKNEFGDVHQPPSRNLAKLIYQHIFEVKS